MEDAIRRPGEFRFLLIVGILVSWRSVCLGDTPPSVTAEKVDAAVARAAHWFLEQQSEDGRWPSQTYGVLRSGVGTTAIVLQALAEISPEKGTPAAESFHRGVQPLTGNLSKIGLVQAPDGRSDSPIYGTALLLTASEKFQPLPKDLKQKLITGLIQSQQIPQNGWPADAVGRGGWGVEPDPATVDSNPANLSVTVHVLSALNATGAITSDIKMEALGFLNHCRNPRFQPDGGFWFLPRKNDELNKGGVFVNPLGEIQPHSYSTATSDGTLALLRLGFPIQEVDVEQAMDAYLKQPLIPVPKLPTEPDEILPPLSGLYFYHAASLSQIWKESSDPRLLPKRNQVLSELISLQKEDGSWENPVPWMREDDPLIATSLAVIAIKRLSAPERESTPSR